MTKHRQTADLVAGGQGYDQDGGSNRPAITAGLGAPSDTTDISMVYIRLDATSGDNVLYTWDVTAGTWDAMTV